MVYMDIVQRLRAMGENEFYDGPATSYRNCQEAADEIERLRYELETIRRNLTALADKAGRARDNAAEQ